MEKMAGMDGSMSGMQHAAAHGFVGEVLGFAGRLSAELLIVLTSAPVLRMLVALVLLLALAALLRPYLANRMSRS
jgi:hypothetical protein